MFLIFLHIPPEPKNKKIHALGSNYNLSLTLQDSWANHLSSFQEFEQVKGRNRTLFSVSEHSSNEAELMLVKG